MSLHMVTDGQNHVKGIDGYIYTFDMILYIFCKWSTTHLSRSLETNAVASCTKIWGQFCYRHKNYVWNIKLRRKQSSSIVSKMPTQPFEAQLLITQPTFSCVTLFPVFLSSLSFFASYHVHQLWRRGEATSILAKRSVWLFTSHSSQMLI